MHTRMLGLMEWPSCTRLRRLLHVCDTAHHAAQHQNGCMLAERTLLAQCVWVTHRLTAMPHRQDSSTAMLGVLRLPPVHAAAAGKASSP